jgi:3-phosphoglycerate kinase
MLKKPDVSDIFQKIVLIRADLDVPLKKGNNGFEVSETNRLEKALETIKFLTENKATCLLIGHLGRPGGKPNPDKSFAPVAKSLSKLLERDITFIPNCIGSETKQTISQLQPGSVAILENLRFHPGEQKNDLKFTKELASLADVYINECFSTSHRKHASIIGLPKLLPAFAGKNLEHEVDTFHKLMTKPKRPFVMVIGGAKISDKVAAVEHLTDIADAVLVGGGVANNFLKAEGFKIAKSYLQDTPADLKKKGVDYVDMAEDLINDTKQERLMIDGYIPLPKIIYPTDVIAAPSLESKSGKTIELVNGERDQAIADNLMFLDIGPKTIRLFKEVILQAGTIFWNGPMGVFEKTAFADGTHEIAKTIAKSSATTILGGGDTIAAIEKFKLRGRFDYVSTAGGAALAFLAGKELPGVTPLLKNPKRHHKK